jgi:LysR family hydrogen peroxide-inducible transcriptional activator
MVASGQGITLLPEMAAAVLAARGSGVGVTRFAPAPGRDVGLVWRMSSARGRELGMLGDVIRAEAVAHLGAVRRKKSP